MCKGTPKIKVNFIEAKDEKKSSLKDDVVLSDTRRFPFHLFKVYLHRNFSRKIRGMVHMFYTIYLTPRYLELTQPIRENIQCKYGLVVKKVVQQKSNVRVLAACDGTERGRSLLLNPVPLSIVVYYNTSSERN